MKPYYPSWDDLHYCLYKQLLELKPNETCSFKHSNGNLNEIIKALANGKNLDAILIKIGTLIAGDPNPNNPTLDEYRQYIHLQKNEFYSVFNMETQSYSFVSDEIKNTLGIEPASLDLNLLMGTSNRFQLAHPEDSKHIMRFALSSYIITSIYNFKYHAFDNTYTVRFRLKHLNSDSYSMVTKKSFLVHLKPSEGSENSHVDIWNFTNDTKDFRKVSYAINIPDDAEMTLIQNQLIALCNARILGFSVKEIFYLNYWMKFENLTVLTDVLNDAPFKFEHKISLKSVRDFIYTLKKKIVAIYLFITAPLDEHRQLQIANSSPVKIADQLGLLDFNERFLNLITHQTHKAAV